MSSNFNKVRPLTTELPALERLKNHCCVHSSAVIFKWTFFILADDKDNHEVSDKFEFQPDPNMDCGVSCPGVSEKIPIDLQGRKVVNTLAPSHLIGGNKDMHINVDGFDFNEIQPLTTVFSCP